MTARLFILIDDDVRARAARHILDTAPAGHLVKVVPPERTREQDKLAHSCFRDFAAHARMDDGQRANEDEWKAKLKVDFWDETGNDPEFADDWRGIAPTLQPIKGTNYVLVSEIRSSRFPRRLFAAFISFIHASGDARGVTWSPTSLGRDAKA